MKYIYGVDLDVMEKTYLENAGHIFFADDDQRKKFNAELVIEAENEDEALKMRVGMTDVRMWELIRIEE